MHNLHSALVYLGSCSIFYCISKWFYLSYLGFPEDQRGYSPATRYQLLAGIFRVLSFPLSFVFWYLDSEHAELVRRETSSKTSTYWVEKLNEAENEIWTDQGSRKTKELLFAQSVWMEATDFCKTHGYSDSLQFRIHLYACLHYLLKDTMYRYAVGNILKRNLQGILRHYTNLDFQNREQVDELVACHDRFLQILQEDNRHPQATDYRSALSSTFLWGVPDEDYKASKYDSSDENVMHDFYSRVRKLKSCATALFPLDF